LLEFERKFAEYIGAKHAIAVSNGSASIYVALRACGIGQGDLVAVSPYTHIGSVAPILLAGAVPMFNDVDKQGNINPKELQKSLRKNPLKGIVAAHQLGMPCELDEFPSGVPIIEDCSQALGAEYKGQKVGRVGVVGCFSLGGDMTKMISTGEGGMIVTNDDRIAEKCRNIRNHGEKNGANYLCFNFRMSDLQAAVGLLQMDSLQFQVDWQIRNAKFIASVLPDCLELPQPPSYMKSACYIIGCRFLDEKAGMSRDSFLEALKMKGLDNGIPRRTIGGGYSGLLYELPFYQRFARKCPTAEKLRDESIWIDWHRYPITSEEISDHLISGLKEIIR
jgi:perosamine synthetase